MKKVGKGEKSGGKVVEKFVTTTATIGTFSATNGSEIVVSFGLIMIIYIIMLVRFQTSFQTC